MDPIATFLYVAGDKRLDHQVLLLAARDGVLTVVPGVPNKETWKDLSRGKISLTNVVENFTHEIVYQVAFTPYGCLLAGGLGSGEMVEAVKVLGGCPLPGAGL